jgi:hypothetical protein
MFGMSMFLPGEDRKPHAVRNFVFSLITVFILLAALPIGVHLVGQNTNFFPEAAAPVATPTPVSGDTGFSFDLKQDSKSGSIIGVNVLVRSDVHPANVFATKISFPEDILSVDSIATNSASLNVDKSQIGAKWADVEFDNDSGTVTLSGGIPNPGLKTNPDQKYVLTTIYFKPKMQAQAKLSFDPNSKVFQAGSILPSKKTDVLLKVPSPTIAEAEVTPSCVPYPACFNDAKPCDLPEPSGGWCRTPEVIASKKVQEPILVLLEPTGGESLDLNSEHLIRWNAANLNNVTVAILMNDQILGNIASVSASLQQLSWTPKDFIYPTFANVNNSFKIKITGVDDKGNLISDQSKGPIGIGAGGGAQSASNTQYDGDINSDGKVDLADLSTLFSVYGDKLNQPKADLNGDRVVNDIDLWVFTNHFGQNKKL